MPDIVSEKFFEWTRELGPVESRISIFRHIRDIPYAVIPELIDCSRGPADILFRNKGSCSPKHFLLAEMFRKLGLSVQYASYPFRWNSLAVHFPPRIKRILGRLPVDYHLACRTRIHEQWVMVDATWDTPLKTAGFPVVENWDGMHDTLPAVFPLEEITHATSEERMSFIRLKESLYTGEETALYREFVEELNSWLDEIRRR